MTRPDDVRRAMGWQERHPALQVRCPHCGAGEGARCTTRSGRRPVDAPHLGRLIAAGIEPEPEPYQPPSPTAC